MTTKISASGPMALTGTLGLAGVALLGHLTTTEPQSSRIPLLEPSPSGEVTRIVGTTQPVKGEPQVVVGESQIIGGEGRLNPIFNTSLSPTGDGGDTAGVIPKSQKRVTDIPSKLEQISYLADGSMTKIGVRNKMSEKDYNKKVAEVTIKLFEGDIKKNIAFLGKTSTVVFQEAIFDYIQKNEFNGDLRHYGDNISKVSIDLMAHILRTNPRAENISLLLGTNNSSLIAKVYDKLGESSQEGEKGEYERLATLTSVFFGIQETAGKKTLINFKEDINGEIDVYIREGGIIIDKKGPEILGIEPNEFRKITLAYYENKENIKKMTNIIFDNAGKKENNTFLTNLSLRMDKSNMELKEFEGKLIKI